MKIPSLSIALLAAAGALMLQACCCMQERYVSLHNGSIGRADSALAVDLALRMYRRDGSGVPLRVTQLYYDGAGFLVWVWPAETSALGGGKLIRVDGRGLVGVLESYQ